MWCCTCRLAMRLTLCLLFQGVAQSHVFADAHVCQFIFGTLLIMRKLQLPQGYKCNQYSVSLKSCPLCIHRMTHFLEWETLLRSLARSSLNPHISDLAFLRSPNIVLLFLNLCAFIRQLAEMGLERRQVRDSKICAALWSSCW